MPYSDFKKAKGRPVLVFKTIDKNDLLVLPLTTNLEREGIKVSNKDIRDGSLKKESVIIVGEEGVVFEVGLPIVKPFYEKPKTI